MIKRFIPSSALTKQSLNSHAWIGICVSALMYLVCISGTLAVFYQEFERWEQPQIGESLVYQPEQIEQAYQHFLTKHPEINDDHILIRLPTEDLPRASISADKHKWFIESDGSLTQQGVSPITKMITGLHVSLHLPENIGMVIVSILGVLLTSLIISGMMAHRRIFKDAFNLRGGFASLLQQTDLHNRLSVWGLPFHLMIAITGAFFGLAIYIAGIYNQVLYENDFKALMADAYGAVPQIENAAPQVKISQALNKLSQIAPDTVPVFITVEEAKTDKQFILIGAQHTDKLIYSEQYRFTASGDYIDAAGFTSGPAGQQAIFSVYRLHFGHFGSEFVKVLYGILGFALTVICVSGINIWLTKRNKQDLLNPVWTAIVWGTPLSFAISAVFQLVAGLPAIYCFWIMLCGYILVACFQNRQKCFELWSVRLTAASVFILVFTHMMLNAQASWQNISLVVNMGLLFIAVLIWLYSQKLNRQI